MATWTPSAVYVIWLSIALVYSAYADVTSKQSGDELLISKKYSSNKMRLLFSLGLEGAGHHYVGAAIDHMYQQHSDIRPLIQCNLSDSFDLRAWALGESGYIQDVDTARANMRELAQAAHTLPVAGGLATMQGCGPEGWQSWLSYPNFPGPDKAMQYLDLRMLASVAEAERVDLRIVYLRRSATEIIRSTTEHRHFQRTSRRWGTAGGTPKQDFERYIRILLTDVGVIFSMLAEIGVDFVVCHDYSRLGDLTQAERIANFVAPTLYMATALTKSLVDTALTHGRIAEMESEYPDVLAERLQLKLDVIDNVFCKEA